MKIKWVCPVCNSTNICEKSDRMKCFVCDYVLETVELEKHGFSYKIKEFFKSLRGAFTTKRESATSSDIINWKFRRSPNDSKEAYIEAVPIYSEDRCLLDRDEDITESESTDMDLEVVTPWPEHRIRFNMEKLNSTGCIKIERTELRGTKCYKLTYRNGTERVVTASNMKLLGYASGI